MKLSRKSCLISASTQAVIGCYLLPSLANLVVRRPEQMRELYEICQSKRKVWKGLPSGTHNETVFQPGYFEYIAEFIDEILGDSSK